MTIIKPSCLPFIWVNISKNMTKSCGLLCFFFLLIVPDMQAQSSNLFGNNRFFTGGGLGLQIGTITFIDVSPHLGYYFTEKWAGGIGLTYQYYSDKRFNPKFTADVMGGRLFARYYILEEVFAHVEYEYLSYESALLDPLGLFIKPRRVEVSNYLVGGGYRQQLGRLVYVNLLVLWNLNETTYSIYENPIIRMGMDVGL